MGSADNTTFIECRPHLPQCGIGCSIHSMALITSAEAHPVGAALTLAQLRPDQLLNQPPPHGSTPSPLCGSSAVRNSRGHSIGCIVIHSVNNVRISSNIP